MSPGKIDRSVVERHLTALDAALQRLRCHAGKPAAVLAADPDESWVVERGLQLCCQNALDLALHLVAEAGQEANDYTQSIDVLAELGIIPKDFSAEFRKMGAFRNALVHGYLRVDHDVLHRVLNEKLDDFVTFSRYVRAHIDGERVAD